MRQKFFLFSSTHETGNLLPQRPLPCPSWLRQRRVRVRDSADNGTNGKHSIPRNNGLLPFERCDVVDLATAHSKHRSTCFGLSDNRHHLGLKPVARACLFYVFSPQGFFSSSFLRFLHPQKGSFGPPQPVSHISRPSFARRLLSKVHSRPYIYEKSLEVGMVHICFLFHPVWCVYRMGVHEVGKIEMRLLCIFADKKGGSCCFLFPFLFLCVVSYVQPHLLGCMSSYPWVQVKG